MWQLLSILLKNTKGYVDKGDGMQDVIDKYKQRNGDAVYTLKEMTMYLVEKVDKIDEKLGKGAVKIGTNRVNIKLLWTAFFTITLVLVWKLIL